VVGAGIVGASCAHELASRGLRVRVLEARSAPGEGSTGRSFASVRAQWGDALNIELSWRSIQMYRDFERLHGTSVDYRPTGYMFLAPEALWETQLARVELQRGHGVPVEILDTATAQQKTPFDAADLAGATWGSADGVVDPLAAIQVYLRLARADGADVRLRHPISAIAREQDHWVVETAAGTFTSSWIVNAAGGWAGEVAGFAGLDLPVNHVRRCIYSTRPQQGRKPLPMTVDLGTGAFLRSEGERVLFSVANLDEPLGYDTSVDWGWFETVLTTMCERFPWLADEPLDRGGAWAGTYEVTPDHFPVLGANPSAPTWVDACGFSGHGVMQAPMVGVLVAEEVVDGRAHSLDIDQLRVERFTDTGGAHVQMVF
jgi:sarcosine oxidase subunit beta